MTIAPAFTYAAIAPAHAGAPVPVQPRVRERSDALTFGAPRFALGRVLVTPGALRALEDAERVRGHGARRSGADGLPARSLATELLARHVAGEWGEVDAADGQANDEGIASEARLRSTYVLPSGGRLWILTEADRSATTVLLPEEY